LIEILKGIHETVDYHADFKIRVYQNNEYEDYPKHWHTDTEIIMPVENTYKVIIDEKTYNLDVEDIIIIPSGELHQLYAPPTGCRIILQFDCNMLFSLNGFNSVFHMFHPCVTVAPSSMPNIHKELSSLILSITSEYFSTLPLREASVYSMLIRFFATLGRDCINRNVEFSNMINKKQPEYVNLFFNVCNYINEHCTENIKLDDIANIAGFSKFHFERLFKQVININCYDYLINRRIMQAEKLLIKPDLSIMQVALKSGFSSLATFNRLFKAKKRCTPTEYKSLYGIY
jgi:AraC-like DNA-binding protein